MSNAENSVLNNHGHIFSEYFFLNDLFIFKVFEHVLISNDPNVNVEFNSFKFCADGILRTF